MAWILKTIRDLHLDPEPHVAVMPLGTGNDLSLSFGWGNTFLSSWINVGPSWMPTHLTPHRRPLTCSAALCKTRNACSLATTYRCFLAGARFARGLYQCGLKTMSLHL